MKFVQRKVTTAKSKYRPTDFKELKRSFLEEVVAVTTMEEIPAELILYCDQTGLRLIPSATWTMAEQGVRRVDIAGAKDKRMITAVLCGTLIGDFLPVQVIYQGKTERCHPCFDFPPDWHITRTPKH